MANSQIKTKPSAVLIESLTELDDAIKQYQKSSPESHRTHLNSLNNLFWNQRAPVEHRDFTQETIDHILCVNLLLEAVSEKHANLYEDFRTELYDRSLPKLKIYISRFQSEAKELDDRTKQLCDRVMKDVEQVNKELKPALKQDSTYQNRRLP